MKIVIERAEKEIELQQQIMLIVDKATNSTTLEKLIDEIDFLKFVRKINGKLITYGQGGQHVWVSVKDKELY